MQEGGLTVVSVELVEEEIDVFDIEVEGDHSFLVHGAVLHNCAACGRLDGLSWDMDGNPIGHSIAYPGSYIHWQDRCARLPKTMSWEALAKEAHGNSRLAKELDKMPQCNRASMGGPVSGNLRYEDWFNGQSPERQIEILGPGRMALYKKGNLDFQAMIGQDGNPLTLKQLEARI